MGGQLTKEQAYLPIAYVSAKDADRRSRILASSTTTAHTSQKEREPSDTLLSDSLDLNLHLQNMMNHLNPTNAVETASVRTVLTDAITPEVVMQDKSLDEASHAEYYRLEAYMAGCYGSAEIGHPCDSSANEGLSPMLFSELPNLTSINMCGLSLVKLSPNVCYLFATTKLQICCNDLTCIPPEIGYMKNLECLDVSKNQLQHIPDTVGFLHKLLELKLSSNQLTSVPSSIGSLKKLLSLHLDNNQITELLPEIGDIKTLVTLDVGDNPLTVLPAEIGRLQYLRWLRVENCPLKTEFVHEIAQSPPTLMELAARTIVRKQIPILQDTTRVMKNYLMSAKKCSSCNGPYFDSFVKRGKIMDKSGITIPLEYRLCCAHWNTEQERLSLMFCPPPETAPSAEPWRHPRTQQQQDVMTIENTPVDIDKLHQRRLSARSIAMPLNSLTCAPTLPNLPNLPRSSSPQPSMNDRSDEKSVRKSRRSIGLWRSRKNSAATIILGKPTPRNSTTSRLGSRWRI